MHFFTMKLLRLICSFHWNHSLLSIAAAGDPRIIPWNFITDLLHESIYHILYLIFFYLSSPISAFLSGILKKKPVFFSIFGIFPWTVCLCFLFSTVSILSTPGFSTFSTNFIFSFPFLQNSAYNTIFSSIFTEFISFFVRYATFFSVFFPPSSSV